MNFIVWIVVGGLIGWRPGTASIAGAAIREPGTGMLPAWRAEDAATPNDLIPNDPRFDPVQPPEPTLPP